MTELRETFPMDASRILSEQEVNSLHQHVIQTLQIERPEIMDAHTSEVDTLIGNGIGILQKFEKATDKKHPDIHTDTDIVYIDSGPGPYSYNMLEPGKTDLDDTVYHKWQWSRKMDRARIRAAYVLTAMITAKRIQEQTGEVKPTKNLTEEDFEKYGPYLMYASVDWQMSHVKHARDLSREKGAFKIPDSKIISYQDLTTREGEQKPIIHTEDQIEGLHFPPFEEGHPPRRIVMVSQPAHLIKIMHILGKYPDSIPQGTVLQLFPVSTPKLGVTEFAKAELIGTIVSIYKKGRASLTPYANYEI